MTVRVHGGVLFGPGEWEELVARVGEDAMREAIRKTVTPEAVASIEARALAWLSGELRAHAAEVRSRGASVEFPAA